MTTSGPSVDQRGLESETGVAHAPADGNRVILVLGAPGAGHPALGRWLEDLGLPVLGADASLGTDIDGVGGTPEPGVPAAAVVVLVWRSPESTVAALATEGIDPAHAVALWEGGLVHALRRASGLPLLGLDLDQTPTPLPLLAEFLTGLAITVPGEAADRSGPLTAELTTAPSERGFGGDHELAAMTEAIRSRLAPVLAAAAGAHATWEAPGDLAVGSTSAAILAAHRAARRASLDAASAWAAVHEAQLAAADAKAAVEREHRELVGPDPVHYAELRRELWRLRDEFAGIVAGRTNYHIAWMRADAARLAAEQRVADLLSQLASLSSVRAERDEMRRERDEILDSERWRIGGLVLEPLARLRRARRR